MSFGKFSAEDLRLLLAFVPQFHLDRLELKELARKKQEALFAKNGTRGYWCNFYEMPFAEHLGKYLKAMGLADEAKEIVEAPNQLQALASAVAKFEADTSLDDLSAEQIEEFRPAIPLFLALVTSVTNSLRCLLMFGCYLNDLVARARLGDEVALMNAVKIDPTVVGCPSIMVQICRATLINDQRFFAKLKAALDGKFQKREQANFQKMRLVFTVLNDAGAGKLSDEQLHELFVKELRLYASDAKTKRGDVKKNLRKLANGYMKFATT